MRNTQDLSGYGEERDDYPPPRTIPDTATPGERFMEAAPHGRFDVYDWCSEECGCVDAGMPSPSCPGCKGTGNGPDYPEVIAYDLREEDARLLAFGGGLLAACEALLSEIDGDNSTFQFSKKLIVAIEAAVAKAKGE